MSLSADDLVRLVRAASASSASAQLQSNPRLSHHQQSLQQEEHATTHLPFRTTYETDAATGQVVGEPMRGHTSMVTSVSWSPDGKQVASGSYDNTVRVWDAATGSCVATCTPH